MLGKLMKYEFKATARVFLPLFGAMLIVAAITQLLNGLRSDTPYIISLVLSFMLITAAFVMTLILTIQRFYKNFLSNEGYLMHTLPVSTGKLIWSKLLVATIWTIVCAAVVFIAIFILAIHEVNLQSFLHSFDNMGLPTGDTILMIAELVAMTLVTLMCSILSLYACMALSMLFNKHRVAISFAFFIAATTIVQIFTAIIVSFRARSMAGIVISMDANTPYLSRNGAETVLQTADISMIHANVLWYLLITALIGAGFYALTHYMLKRKLNLQ